MTKQEFLRELGRELRGRLPERTVRENLDYYEQYIDGERARGRSEEEIIEELGGPRIIARTIVDAAADSEDRPDGFDTMEEETPRQESFWESESTHKVHYLDFNKWYVRLGAGIVVALVLLVFFGILAAVFGAAMWLLSVLWPVLLIVLIFIAIRGPRR